MSMSGYQQEGPKGLGDYPSWKELTMPDEKEAAPKKKFFFEMRITGEIDDVMNENQADLVVRNAVSVATRLEQWDMDVMITELVVDDTPAAELKEDR